jgi:hypothetical protein
MDEKWTTKGELEILAHMAKHGTAGDSESGRVPALYEVIQHVLADPEVEAVTPYWPKDMPAILEDIGCEVVRVTDVRKWETFELRLLVSRWRQCSVSDWRRILHNARDTAMRSTPT